MSSGKLLFNIFALANIGLGSGNKWLVKDLKSISIPIKVAG